MYLKGYAWLIVCCVVNGVVAQVPVGGWREHLPYQKAAMVVATAEKIFCATPYALFSVDIRENNIERLSKMNGLHEVGISRHRVR